MGNYIEGVRKEGYHKNYWLREEHYVIFGIDTSYWVTDSREGWLNIPLVVWSIHFISFDEHWFWSLCIVVLQIFHSSIWLASLEREIDEILYKHDIGILVTKGIERQEWQFNRNLKKDTTRCNSLG